jgi:hypothetical protein
VNIPGADHAALPDPMAARRYFAQFARIIMHLRDVAKVTNTKGLGDLQNLQIDLIENYMGRLSNTLTALSIKHLMAGRVAAMPAMLAIDRRDSGFPVFQEIMTMANDFAQAGRHLGSLPDQAQLKQAMVAHILSERTPPIDLQYAMSQRIYYETLKTREIFFAQNHPQIIRLATKSSDAWAFLVHWAVYDSELSLPVVYLMVVEDTGHVPLDQDQRRWPQAQARLLAQSISALKLLTIARGFDEDFDDLHPKFFRRIHVGPMYSHAFTEQTGPLREVLAEVSGHAESDWALSWMTETLVSSRTELVSTGFFSSVQREIFDLNQNEPASAEAGVTRLERSLILPIRPYQVLADRNDPGMRDVRKHVVAEDGTLLTGL